MGTEQDYSWLITNKSVTVSYKGVSHTILRNEKNCDDLIAAIKNKEWDEIPKFLSPEIAVANRSDGDMRIENGQVWVKVPKGHRQDDGTEVDIKFAVPSGLNGTIIKYLDDGLPFRPLVKFAIKLSH